MLEWPIYRPENTKERDKNLYQILYCKTRHFEFKFHKTIKETNFTKPIAGGGGEIPNPQIPMVAHASFTGGKWPPTRV